MLILPMKIMRQLKKCLLLLTVFILLILASQIASLWREYTWFKETEAVTDDPWQKKHWKHVKILTDSLIQMRGSKTILLWTKFFGAPDFIPKLSSLGCPLPKCSITSDRSFLNKTDAVIFHLRDMDLHDMPAFRMPKQIWILVHHESPPHTPDILKNLDGVFNWTATYRFDSEILLTPLVKKRSHPITDMTNYARNKKRMVVWLVSNCKTPSRREEYVAELQKYIPVHIYGSCGQYSCLPKMSDECYQKLGKVYRYYLSFENSICKDYVTEKLYHVLNTNMVPVVLGGANYSVVAPPHSFIDALSFKTPRDLAQYLLEIAKDDKRYNQFFAWKQTHELSSEHYACKICRMLNEAKMKSSTYINVSKWWFQEANCKSWSPLSVS